MSQDIYAEQYQIMLREKNKLIEELFGLFKQLGNTEKDQDIITIEYNNIKFNLNITPSLLYFESEKDKELFDDMMGYR